MDAAETARILQHLRGDGFVYRAYSDNHRSLRKACQLLGIMWEASQPGVHQTNARVERCDKDVLEGFRTLLVQAGFPCCFGRMPRDLLPSQQLCYWRRRGFSVVSTARVPL